MSNYTVEVPFQQFGNRRGFTARQLKADETASQFYQRFKHCFEPHPDYNIDAVLFIEQGAASG